MRWIMMQAETLLHVFCLKQVKEIILPEFQEMLVAHITTIGSEIASATNVYFSEE
jgi:hypothetical protein